MMKATFISAALLFGLVATSAACGGGDETAPPTPTAIPPVSTPEEPSTSAELDDPALLARIAWLDMAMTLDDLAGEVDRWKAGDAEAIEEARELMERLQTVWKHVAWPSGLESSLGPFEEALAALSSALETADVASVDAALAAQTEALHDLEHDLDARPFPAASGDITVRAAYHELSMRLQALEEALSSWKPGEAAPEEADEDVERIEAILNGVSWPASLAASIDALDTAFHDVEEALTSGDAAAMAARLPALSEARHDAEHAFFEWLAGQPPASGHAAAHVAVLDLRALATAWRAEVDAWRQGDAAALDEAEEAAERIEAVLDSVSWPPALTAAVEALDTAFHDAESAAAAGDSGTTAELAQAFDEAYHDLLHEFSAWLEGEGPGGA